MLYEDLGAEEECLLGSWLSRGGRVEGDLACKRINWLITPT